VTSEVHFDTDQGSLRRLNSNSDGRAGHFLSSKGSYSMAGNSKDEGRSVADKVIAIMCAFQHGEELSNAQIARLAALPFSTSHRLLGELVVGGMLERTAHRRYRVGPNIQAIARKGSMRPVGTGQPMGIGRAAT
jgi:hypothetical protein